jgi:hypothetical protein
MVQRKVYAGDFRVLLQARLTYEKLWHSVIPRLSRVLEQGCCKRLEVISALLQ